MEYESKAKSFNEFQTECFFKSDELAELCKQGKDIIVTIKVSYPAGTPPTFDIQADVHKPADSIGKVIGCPTPCR